MNVINILLGLLLVTAGRRLYWFFVGVAGFLLGFSLAERFLPGQADWVRYLIAVGAGLLAVLFAVGLQRFAIVLAGFLTGWFLAQTALGLIGWDAGALIWVICAFAGLLGAVLTAFLFDWGLIGLSSVLGAGLIAQALSLEGWGAGAVIAILTVVGMIFQASMKTSSPPKPRRAD